MLVLIYGSKGWIGTQVCNLLNELDFNYSISFSKNLKYKKIKIAHNNIDKIKAFFIFFFPFLEKRKYIRGNIKIRRSRMI